MKTKEIANGRADEIEEKAGKRWEMHSAMIDCRGNIIFGMKNINNRLL